MPTINDRIVELIETLGLKKSQFAEKLSVSQPYISQLCSGVRTPSDRTISDICREFNIRREWLETGEGPMKLPEPEADLDYINILMASCDSPFKDLIRAILLAYARSTPAIQKAINDSIDQILSELDKRK